MWRIFFTDKLNKRVNSFELNFLKAIPFIIYA